MVLEGSEVKPKLKRQLRYVWSSRTTSQPRTDLKKKQWSTSGRKLSMDDDTLWNELEPYTSKVRKWSRNSSIKRTHLRCKRALTTMSYQTLARRLRLHTQHIEQSAGNKLLKMELLKMRAIAEAEAIARLRALCAELSVYKMHFWLSDTLNERLWHDKLHPRKHTIYAWCDFADPLIL